MQAVARERRVSPRVEVALDLRLARKVGNAVTVRTRDLSVGGAYVVSDRPLRIYEEVRFDLELPAAGEHVEGMARVLRQHRHDAYALRFERVAPAALSVLDAFVESSAASVS